MIDNPYLDTLISLVLVYASLSVLVSALLEWINKGLRERGTFLKRMIERMINDPNNLDFGHLLYAHPLIARLRKDVKALPSYISGDAFATALTDIMGERGWTMKSQDAGDGLYRWVKEDEGESLEKRFRKGVLGLKDSQLKSVLLGMADRSAKSAAATDLEALRKNLARWYDDHMDRIGGEYKDAQRWKLYILGFFIAFALNVDSIHLVRVFFLNEPLRDSMVARSEDAADQYSALPDSLQKDWHAQLSIVHGVKPELAVSDTARQQQRAQVDSAVARISRAVASVEDADAHVASVDSVMEALAQWGLPIGYADDEPPVIWCKKNDTDNKEVQGRLALLNNDPLLRYFDERANHPLLYFFLWLLGVCITGLALSAGAPFWFATLVKLINIRRAGNKPPRADEPKAT